MSRNSSGTYSLPAGNPVVSGTVISSSWGNSTLSDIATALTDSLSRSGLGGMTAPLLLPDGTAGLPAIAFTLDPNTGLYRIGADNLGFATAGTLRGNVNSTGNWSIAAPSSGTALAVTGLVGTNLFTVSDGTRTFGVQTDASTVFMGSTTNHNLDLFSNNNIRARLQASDGEFYIYDDSGIVPAGFRHLTFRTLSTTGNAAQTDGGKMIVLAGATFTVTFPSMITGTTITLLNTDTASKTVAVSSGTLQWVNGTGTLGTGSRTLAVASTATMWWSGSNWFIWGNGIT
jgi:hypothetical protein